ncbi:MAG: sodium-translocating pyrophosphatase [Planctomycetia bacterium]|nr:sodium-translocating pyrophosphatase [Planctomycetia bacterium]
MSDRVPFSGKYGFFWLLSLAGSIAALIFARCFYVTMMKADEGNKEMVDIAAAVREGADAYLWQQYKVVGIFFVVICAFLAYLAFGLGVQNKIVPLAFLTGGFFSGLAGWCGMKTATWASSRTAAGAMKSLNQGLQVAFRSGAVMGLTVVGLGLLDIVLWFGLLYWVFPVYFNWHMDLTEITVVMLCFGMGASSQALFARVGGGIYTKAADVGADLVGKVEAGIPEDDKRNPATIADNVGDNVGDVAGMGADLYESYCGSILSTAALGVAAYAAMGASIDMQLNALFLPVLLAAVGIVLSICGIFLVRTEESADQGTLLKALGKGVNAPSVVIAIASIAIAYFMMSGTAKYAGFSVVTGLAAGWLIGKWTEYRTSYEYKPTQAIAEQGKTGPATVIIAGIAEGMFSTWAPVVIVGIATLLSFGFTTGFNFADVKLFSLGLFGVGIAAVGMLSTLGVTLATDAYGPIADNAGGNAEMSELPPEVRERTDALDSLGNTTAATGKGFAIGSAALTALALLAAYIEEVRVGFERWGATAVEVIETNKENPAGYYKVADQFVVFYPGFDATEEEKEQYKEAGKEWFPKSYLVMPNQASNPNDTGLIYRDAKTTWKQSNEAWAALDTSKGPTYIPFESSLSDKGEEVLGAAVLCPFIPESIDAPATDMVGVKSANMMDWMNYYTCNLLNPKVLVGIFLGAMSVFVFGAMTMMAVGRAASGMVEEVRRQFREIPGIMEYKNKPDYKKPVAISTQAAQREMILPSLLGLILPVVVGLLLGVTGVIGLLVGTLTTGFCVAVYMANAGGAWDNAKKYVETGVLGGKKSDTHKATVVGDTVGDPFKDTTGPSLNILIKLMSMVSVVAAGLIVKYTLF